MYYGDYDCVYDGEYSDYDGAGYDDDWYGDDGWQDEVYHGDFPLEEWTWPASAPDSSTVSTAGTTVLDDCKGFGAKGKGPSGGSASGIGCATCGSRWHSSLDCPLNDPSKGDQGKGKKDYHYENFWKGKGKGKKGGKSKGFGKGWSKGFGKYRPSFGSGKGYGKYSGGYGKSYGKSYGKADGSGTQYYDFEDEKPSSSTRPPPQSTTEPMIDTAGNPGYNDGYGELDTAPASMPDVRVNSLSFLVGACSSAFPTDHEDWSSLYRSVRGVKRHGLLIDPGAASGLIGSDTLKEFRDEILLPLGFDIICRPTTQNVSGISGKPEPALSRVTMPIFPGIKSSTFTADVIGKQGSKCPALLPNPSIRAANMGLLTNFFENGDGMLTVHDNGKRLLYRCLLTESGHYILPTDNVKNNNNVDEKATRKASAFYAAVLQDATQQWSDISSVYLAVDKAAVADPVADRAPPSTRSTGWKQSLDIITTTSTGLPVTNNSHEDSTSTAKLSLSTSLSLPTTTPLSTLPTTSNSLTTTPVITTTTSLPTTTTTTSVRNTNTLQPYINDQLPPYWDPNKQRHFNNKYKSIPEEYYNNSKQSVVTPDNFHVYMQRTTETTWDLWEHCSGSGRLSLIALRAGLRVGFPVDSRYGWDLRNDSHRKLLDAAFVRFRPGMHFTAPDCRIWGQAGNRADPYERELERELDRPSLLWLHEKNKLQDSSGRGYANENPVGSDIFTQSPLLHNQHLSGYKQRQRCDQCQHGSVNEDNEAIQKATFFDANFRRRRTAVRCRTGMHDARPHAQLRGRAPGAPGDRTSMSAVYPRALCKALVHDFQYFLQFINAYTGMIGYTCPKCAEGRHSLEEHTLMPGECRHGPKLKLPVKKTPSNKSPLDTLRNNTLLDPGLRRLRLSTPAQEPYHDKDNNILLKGLIHIIIQDNRRRFSTENSQWIKHEVQLDLMQHIYRDNFHIVGINVTEHPRKMRSAMPTYSVATSYLRVSVTTTDEFNYTLYPHDDLRDCDSQTIAQSLPVNTTWLVTIFGVSFHDAKALEKEGGPDATPVDSKPAPAKTPSTSSPSNPAPATVLDDEPAVPSASKPATATVEDEEPDELDRPVVNPLDIKPSFDLKRVTNRLFRTQDKALQLRLLLGLHERFWHAPQKDLHNLLWRAGAPAEILALIPEVIRVCGVCRLFIRPLSKPSLRAEFAGTFNAIVQTDLFFLWDMVFILFVDEATRYKVIALVINKEYKTWSAALITLWVRYFGPPQVLVSDQESAWMSENAGADFDRLGIIRRPKGSDPHGAKHTGTGLVERHVGLSKVALLKMEAELKRQGLQVTKEEMAAECGMSQNMILSYGGYTPAQAVLGANPRTLYEIEDSTITSVMGAKETNPGVFEHALRLRMIASTAIQRSIMEDRLARAQHVRPQQHDIKDFIPRVTAVDLYRQPARKGESGWRGPADLLDINPENGTAVVRHQGYPYTVPLRHVRKHTELYNTQVHEEEDVNSLFRLMDIVDGVTEGKTFIQGLVLNNENELVYIPAELQIQMTTILKLALQVAAGLLELPAVQGLRYGTRLRRIVSPPRALGHTLIYWNRVNRHDYQVINVNTFDIIHLDKLIGTASYGYSAMLFYNYDDTLVDHKSHPFPLPLPMEQECQPPAEPPQLDSPRPMSTHDESPRSQQQKSTINQPSLWNPLKVKRTRTTPYDDNDPQTTQQPSTSSSNNNPPHVPQLPIVLPHNSPTQQPVPQSPVVSERPLSDAPTLPYDDEDLFNYMMQTEDCKRSLHNVSLRDQRLQAHNDFEKQQRHALTDYLLSLPNIHNCSTDKDNAFLIPGPWHADVYFAMSLTDGKCFRVDTDTDSLTEADLVKHWREVEAADRKELKQFLDQQIFKLRHINSLDTDEGSFVDAIWIRKWKRVPDGSYIIKSRLCARGYLDCQKHLIPTRSTTATRLSQRILVSVSVLLGFDLESWDVSGAFIKGFNFDRLAEIAAKLGHTLPKRKVLLKPPANVWRHFNDLGSKTLSIRLQNRQEYFLELLKAMYGLVDAPLAWQQCLHEFLIEDLQGQQSLFDENFFIWFNAGCSAQALATAHVDDNATAGDKLWLTKSHAHFEGKFGNVTRQTPPFNHTGQRYSQLTPSCRKIDQDEFCQKLQPAEFDDSKSDDAVTTPSDKTKFRSVLGALLWLCITRMDLIAEVVLLQGHVTAPTYGQLRAANALVVRAKKYAAGCGLHFCKLTPPLRILTITDASHASKLSSYAQEGVIVLLTEDRQPRLDLVNKELTDFDCVLQSGRCHVFIGNSNKAKRISSSTSHAETLAATNGRECAQLLAMRLHEILGGQKKISLSAMITVQEHGSWVIPIDHCTDCRDFYELATGVKGVPQDKGQRLYVLSIREDRLTGKIRFFFLIPTSTMLADGLTKVMFSRQLLQLMTSGAYTFFNEDKQPVLIRQLPKRLTYSEQDLIDIVPPAADAAERRNAPEGGSGCFNCGADHFLQHCPFYVTATNGTTTTTDHHPTTSSATRSTTLFTTLIVATQLSTTTSFEITSQALTTVNNYATTVQLYNNSLTYADYSILLLMLYAIIRLTMDIYRFTTYVLGKFARPTAVPGGLHFCGDATRAHCEESIPGGCAALCQLRWQHAGRHDCLTHEPRDAPSSTSSEETQTELPKYQADMLPLFKTRYGERLHLWKSCRTLENSAEANIAELRICLICLARQQGAPGRQYVDV
ncbi:unnamed protein product [Polarella glacialis]|uniref:Integrase catalytic domain-containing protein n=1 Tax=Polarella glacialis TaxID=89957 RepID=A0A813KYY0_POLGL|nr:unnamed protein product [Polarella glacialis]